MYYVFTIVLRRTIMAYIHFTYADPGIFLSGGVQNRRPESSLDNVFFFFSFLVLSLFHSLQRGSNGFIAEKTILSHGSRGGPTFSRGFTIFPGRAFPMLISIHPYNAV